LEISSKRGLLAAANLFLANYDRPRELRQVKEWALAHVRQKKDSFFYAQD
jgi:hypothetical protein